MVPVIGDMELLQQQVRDAAAGDPDAWEALYRRVYPKLFAYARRRLPSDAVADDAVSESMSRAIAQIGGFRWKGGGFDAWMYGIARNVVRETYRQVERSALVGDVPETAIPLPTAARAVDDPADVIDRQVSAAALHEAFKRLSPADQEVLELRVVGELSADEVGVVTGRRSGAVRMAQARALQRLRKLMEGVIHG